MKLPVGAILAVAMILLVGACDTTPPPAGDAIPPGPEGMEGDY
jgi:hypothetical protein